MNIILIDRANCMIEHILKYTDWNIAILVVEGAEQKEFYLSNNRINKIYTAEELVMYDGPIDIDDKIVEFCKSSFMESDYAARRTLNDIHFSHYMFYAGISFWKIIFRENAIDFGLCVGLIHGYPFDLMFEKVSNYYNIPVFNIGIHSIGNRYIEYFSNKLKINHDNEPSIDELKDDTLKSAFYAQSYSNKAQNVFPKKSIRHSVGRLLYRLGGMTLVYNTFLLLSVLRKKDSPKLNYANLHIKDFWSSILHYKKIIANIRKQYSTIDLSSKYIVYFLHLEPEAVLTTYADLVNSQLIFIKMLSESLPAGWKLIVKEHPDFYKFNDHSYSYFISSVKTFSTYYFFDKLQKNNNVFLCDYHLPASKLIDGAQAVSTIAGTVVLESILRKKNIILFANEKRTLYSKCEDVFLITSKKSLMHAIDLIKEGVKPAYDNFYKVIESYTFRDDKLSGWMNAIRTIQRKVDIECIIKPKI